MSGLVRLLELAFTLFFLKPTWTKFYINLYGQIKFNKIEKKLAFILLFYFEIVTIEYI
jgi:hypothetical protein